MKRLVSGAIIGVGCAMFTAAAAGASTTARSQAGQTYWVEQIAEGLSFPSGMAWLPSGELLITERIGGLRILRDDHLDPQPISGVPSAYQSPLDGLRDIAVDPESGPAIYLLLSQGTFEQRHAVVYRARYSPAGLVEVTEIFRSKDVVEGVGSIATRMLLSADKTLLVAVTEMQKQRAQRLDSQIGKVLRINLDGSIPEDNPYLNRPGALPEIWSYGHRAVLGLYEDEKTGQIWAVEPGPRGGDELNRLRAGGNFGWAKTSWGFGYDQKLEAPGQSAPGIEDPILVWMPSATPSGLTRYQGNTYPAWDGDYFAGFLTAKCLERFRIQGDQVVLQERMLLDLDERIRDVKVGPDNRLYILTDHQNARILRLQPGRVPPNKALRVARKREQPAFTIDKASQELTEALAALTANDVARGKQLFLERCASCHSLGAAVRGGAIGPDLEAAYGNPMGRKPGFQYSANMAQRTALWDPGSLNRFLAGPAEFMPGTKMIMPPISDAKTRVQIIGFLKSPQQQPTLGELHE